jgi:hypothetical protein
VTNQAFGLTGTPDRRKVYSSGLAFTGVLLLSSAVVSAAWRRVNQLEQPPREIAKLK